MEHKGIRGICFYFQKFLQPLSQSVVFLKCHFLNCPVLAEVALKTIESIQFEGIFFAGRVRNFNS